MAMAAQTKLRPEQRDVRRKQMLRMAGARPVILGGGSSKSSTRPAVLGG